MMTGLKLYIIAGELMTIATALHPRFPEVVRRFSTSILTGALILIITLWPLWIFLAIKEMKRES